MAYNKRNRLQRIIDIQQIHREHSKDYDGEATDTWIWRELIFPQYRISKRTFDEYLVTPAQRLLKELEMADKKQLSLFEQN